MCGVRCAAQCGAVCGVRCSAVQCGAVRTSAVLERRFPEAEVVAPAEGTTAGSGATTPVAAARPLPWPFLVERWAGEQEEEDEEEEEEGEEDTG